MNSQVRFVVEECVGTYNGTSKSTGDAYVIGTWKLKGVSDGKIFVANAFTALHNTLLESIGLIMDALITVEAREYNGKWYNDVKITTIIPNQENVKADLPTSSTISGAMASTIASASFVGGDNDLPF